MSAITPKRIWEGVASVVKQSEADCYVISRKWKEEI